MRRALSILAAAWAALGSPGDTAAQTPPADMILTNAKAYTPDGWAEAVAIRDGLIAAVGDAAAVDLLRGAGTRIVDLAGAPLFPGLNDAHIHPSTAALERLGCNVPRGASWENVLAVVGACAEAASPDAWIVAGPVESEALIGPWATRQALDAAAPGRAIVVYAVGGHALVVSTLALAAAGIDRSTPAPPGGVIGRDSAGELTGLLQEVPNFNSAIPLPDAAAVAPATAAVLDELLAAGVTSVTEANSIPLQLETYSSLADAGLLKLRVRTCLGWVPPAPVESVMNAGSYTRDRLATDCVKIFVDGESYTGRTAALLEPYLPADGASTDERGALTLPPEALRDAVIRFDGAGLTVKLHAWGDGAVDAALTAIEAAREVNGAGGPMHEVGHVFLAQPREIARARAANAVLEFSPSGWQPPAMAALGKDIGEPRMARAWPVHDALAAGTRAVAGSDWPAGPPIPYSLWVAIETLVTRLDPGALQGDPFAPSQRVTLEQAIALFTAYPAMHSRTPDAPGIIASGRKADLIVLDRDPYAILINEVHLIKTLMTIVDGEIVWEAAIGACDPRREIAGQQCSRERD